MPVEADFQLLMEEATVPGVAAAVIESGRLAQTVCSGVRSALSADLIDEDTVFDAASLTKPVFAHAVLQLADQGSVSLDTPLAHYLPRYFPHDDRVNKITAKHVLSHSAGLPNWRNTEFPLKTYFEPGQQFSYSGEGYLYLQKTIEAVTAERVHTLVEELVLRPLGMTRSSLIWDFRDMTPAPYRCLASRHTVSGAERRACADRSRVGPRLGFGGGPEHLLSMGR